MALKVGMKFPWWKDIYITTVIVMNNLGLIEADAEIAGRFVVKHSWFYTTDTKGRRRYVRMVPR